MTNILQTLPEKIKLVSVNIHGQQVGILAHGSHFIFTYTQPWPNVSLTMPYKAEPYTYGAVHPVFTQNLPEGFVRRFISEKLARYAKIDDMYLLGLMGNRGIGLLEFASDIVLPDTDQLSLDEIIHWSGSEKLFPQLLEKFYLQGMASGVQPKVVINATRAMVPHSQVIVKSFDVEYPLLTVNEFVCMGAAKRCDLNPPAFWLADNLETYVIERFDIDENGFKIGIEDFATLMGKSGDDKYNGSYESLLTAVQLNTHSTEEVEKAFKLVAFNCLIGNGDAHLKNFALQYDVAQTNIKMSPPFDLVHTLIYDDILDKNMALKMRKSKAFPNKNELVNLAYGGGIQRSRAELIIEEMAQSITDHISGSEEVNLLEGLKDSILNQLDKTMTTPAIRAAYSHVKQKKFK